ncbi:MAG: hypothetical protein J7K53_12225 [Bacteroidales bacterium]|nr:hypothetical protein [Bacteroidales bacterium]
MMEVVKNVCLYLVISTIISWITIKLDSVFLVSFLEKNLITLLVALLAINTTTMSIIMVKLRELKDKFGVRFDNTLNSLRISLYEQVSLIPLSILMLVLRDSTVIKQHLAYSSFIWDTALIAIFAYAIHILFDTAKSVFIIITTENSI